jgi:hypothetical protein
MTGSGGGSGYRSGREEVRRFRGAGGRERRGKGEEGVREQGITERILGLGSLEGGELEFLVATGFRTADRAGGLEETTARSVGE